MEFQSAVTLNGKTATGIPVPKAVVAELGGGKRAKISVTLNGYTYRTSFGSVNSTTMIPLSAEQRAGAQVQAGDTVMVQIELDTAPREVSVPDDFAAALAAAPAAQRAFAALSYSNQRRHVLAIEGAKTAETRQRRIAKALAELSA